MDTAPLISPDAIHIPVMADRVVELLSPSLKKPEAIYVDGTLGMGGHAELILQKNPQAHLVGIDRDQDALDLARQRLAQFGDRVHLARARFDELDDVLDDFGIDQVDAALLDLGLSSLQIDRAERGFAYRIDAPLDMRMDRRNAVTAADILNSYEPSKLIHVFREYGEERQATRIVRAIVNERDKQPFVTSKRLVDVVSSAIPAAVRATMNGHPAKRVFQALRIEVNGELDALRGVLPVLLNHTAVDGRIAILSYHSLEDRIVKQTFAAASHDSAPAGLPVVPEAMAAQFKLLIHGAEKPTAEEMANNRRASSAKFRAIMRIRLENK